MCSPGSYAYEDVFVGKMFIIYIISYHNYVYIHHILFGMITSLFN